MITYDYSVGLEVDVSLEGKGVVWDNKAYALEILSWVKQGRNITQFEMYNVVITFRHWAPCWGNSFVNIVF